jgi:hypothetical protein
MVSLYPALVFCNNLKDPQRKIVSLYSSRQRIVSSPPFFSISQTMRSGNQTGANEKNSIRDWITKKKI